MSSSQSPARIAIAIALSVFVGITSIFVAVMLFAIAPLEVRDVGLTERRRMADNIARWACYVLGIVALANGVAILRRGRSNLPIALVCSSLFLFENAALAILYLKAW